MKSELLIWRQSSSKSDWELLAALSGTTTGYLNLIAYGYRKASPKMATSIECASRKIPARPTITKESLVFPRPAGSNHAEVQP